MSIVSNSSTVADLKMIVASLRKAWEWYKKNADPIGPGDEVVDLHPTGSLVPPGTPGAVPVDDIDGMWIVVNKIPRY
ncbi:MAG: hypothetical protein ACR2QC_02125 [Gammaproteobacteria bacterium]